LEALSSLRRAVLGLACASVLAAAPAPPPAREVLAPTGFPGWQTHNVTFPVVVRDPARGVWRMYYTGSATDQVSDSAWDLWSTGVVTSRDLARWTYPEDYEPVLIGQRFLEGDLVDWSGREPPFDAILAATTSVLRDGTEWRAWYTGWNGDERSLGGGRVEQIHSRIGHATSIDGVRWTKRPGGAELGAALGLGATGTIDALSAAHPSLVKVGTTYHLWYEAYDGRAWRIAHARSADGLAWTKDGAVLEPGVEGALDALGARQPVVRKTSAGYELWYQGRSSSRPSFHVLRARSADGLTWTKDAQEVALHPDPPLKEDERIHVGSVLPRPDGSLLVFFAKETAAPRAATWGTLVDRTTAIYSETVRP
jgi:beta-1,4-mannooligosaccharide phosphorylase